MHIDGASSIDDHLRKAVEADFTLSEEIPLHAEVTRSIRTVADSNHMALRAWWKLQLDMAKGVVNSAADLQEFWNCSTTASIRSETGRLQKVDLAFHLETFDLGGANWIQQFTYGAPHSRRSPTGRSVPPRHFLQAVLIPSVTDGVNEGTARL